jgi:beta-phosphoglucomutase-like phosphatase (HAD superfamily)
MSKRKNTFTRFIEDIVDDTKDFVDDIIDRAKDLETDAVDAIKDVVDDDESDALVPSPGVAELEAALAELTAKVNQLAELQLAAASSSSNAASANGAPSSGTSSTRRTAAA